MRSNSSSSGNTPHSLDRRAAKCPLQHSSHPPLSRVPASRSCHPDGSLSLSVTQDASHSRSSNDTRLCLRASGGGRSSTPYLAYDSLSSPASPCKDAAISHRQEDCSTAICPRACCVRSRGSAISVLRTTQLPASDNENFRRAGGLISGL
jgi:hypothetical protein